jgi:hypothetical protein
MAALEIWEMWAWVCIAEFLQKIFMIYLCKATTLSADPVKSGIRISIGANYRTSEVYNAHIQVIVI